MKSSATTFYSKFSFIFSNGCIVQPSNAMNASVSHYLPKPSICSSLIKFHSSRASSTRANIIGKSRRTIFNFDSHEKQMKRGKCVTPESIAELRSEMKKAYSSALQYCQSKKLPDDVDPKAVFACNRLNLTDIDIYGFDYDYTLACYKPELEQLIYDLAREVLIKKFKYPKGVNNLEYHPGFAVRGLHYDIPRGLFLKVDSFSQVQLGTVYRGMTPLSDEEVLQIYGSRKIPLHYIEPHPSQVHNRSDSKHMVQLADLFSLPEMNLLANVTEYMVKNSMDFHPQSLFLDVKESVGSIHPEMHQIVLQKPEDYLEFDPLLREYLETLQEGRKKLFLVTNSPFPFVNKGLGYLLGEDWQDFFEVVVMGARKPMFFSDEHIPLRQYDPKADIKLWDKVTKLEKGKIYYGGTLAQLQKLTGWRGEKVLYFGDHAYTDLADATLHHGWRTAAIIKELTFEIETLNSPEYKYSSNWLQFLTSLLETYQVIDVPEVQDIIKEWQFERDNIRQKAKDIFNEQFGSVFRTHLNPTIFSRRLFRFSDIYTSSITNLVRYSVSHTFYPRRGVLPHEYRSWFN